MHKDSAIQLLARLKRPGNDKPRWPHPEESTGMYYCEIGRHSKCWAVQGIARQTFTHIAEEIKAYLRKHSDPVAYDVIWTMYMIGKTKETAEPMILFCCKEYDCRKQVRRTIDKSGILAKYPGVKTGDTSWPPDIDYLVKLGAQIREEVGQDLGNWERLYKSTRTQEGIKLCNPGVEFSLILRESSDHNRSICGSRLAIKMNDNEDLQWATVGGTLCLNNQVFVTTVAHVFTESRPQSIDDGTNVDFECDIGEEVDSDEEDTGFIEMTSRGSLTPQCSQSSSSDHSARLISDISRSGAGLGQDAREQSSGRNVLGHGTYETSSYDLPKTSSGTIGALYDISLELDFALIEVTNSELKTYNHVQSQGSLNLYPKEVSTELPHDQDIIAVTSSGGILAGTISGTPTYTLLAGSTKNQELWVIRMNGKLARGDCGSWVLQANNGNLIGHIISGSIETGVAYVLPAYQMLEDIKQRKDMTLNLFTRDTNLSPRTLYPLESKHSEILPVDGTTTTESMNTGMITAPQHPHPLKGVLEHNSSPSEITNVKSKFAHLYRTHLPKKSDLPPSPSKSCPLCFRRMDRVGAEICSCSTASKKSYHSQLRITFWSIIDNFTNPSALGALVRRDRSYSLPPLVTPAMAFGFPPTARILNFAPVVEMKRRSRLRIAGKHFWVRQKLTVDLGCHTANWVAVQLVDSLRFDGELLVMTPEEAALSYHVEGGEKIRARGAVKLVWRGIPGGGLQSSANLKNFTTRFLVFAALNPSSDIVVGTQFIVENKILFTPDAMMGDSATSRRRPQKADGKGGSEGVENATKSNKQREGPVSTPKSNTAAGPSDGILYRARGEHFPSMHSGRHSLESLDVIVR